MTGDHGVPPGGWQPAPPGPWVPPQAAPSGLLRRPRRGNTLFVVLVSVAMLLGAVVMAVVLALSNAPDALAIGVVLAAIPVGPVIACFLWLDRYEPEPVPLLVMAFGWGALVATAAALVLQTLDQFVLGTTASWSAAIVAPVTEEAAKGLFILLLLWFRRRLIDGVLDGLVYAGVIGVGFAFTENILYLGGAYMGGNGLGEGGLGSAAGLFIVRGVFSPFAHPLFTAFIGLGVGFAVVATSRAWRVIAPLVGYVVAVLAHGAWNASALFGGGEAFIVTYLVVMIPGFLLVVGFAIWARSREGRMLSRSLGDVADRGLIDPAEVPWLTRLPARRASRRFAKAYGGPAADRVMREYQQQAVELAFLHDRFLRGTAPPDFSQRGAAMVERLRALRPYVGFPQPAGAMQPAVPPRPPAGPRRQAW